VILGSGISYLYDGRKAPRHVGLGCASSPDIVAAISDPVVTLVKLNEITGESTDQKDSMMPKIVANW